jgi:hypothetical protein
VAPGAFCSPLAVASLPPGGSRAPLARSDDGTPGPVLARLSARPAGPGDISTPRRRLGEGIQVVLVALPVVRRAARPRTF